jgi:hypothetical protein
MKKLLLALALTAIQFTNAQAPTAIWQKCYGGFSDDWIMTAPIETSDGGFVVGIQTGSNDGDISGNHGTLDVSLMKINATGIVQWQKCYGGTGHESITKLIQTTDGGYVIFGTTDSNDGNISGNHGVNDFWMVKTNALGTIQWQKCFGGSGEDEIQDVISTSDGGYIACGYTRSINIGDVLGNTTYGGWVIKINDAGVMQWQKVYDTDSAQSHFSRILQTSDGGYALAGHTQLSSFPGFHGGIVDALVAKINQVGTIQWQKCYGGSGAEDGVRGFTATNDGGYIFSIQTESNDGDVTGNHGAGDCWVVKLDASGAIIGQNCYGGSGLEGGGYIQKTLDGGMVISGGTNSNDGNVSGNHGGSDAWTIKFSASGVIQWQKCFGGTANDGGGIFQLADGTYMAGGATYSNDGDISGNHNTATADGFLIKLTAANLANDSFASTTITTYPNPTKDILHIDIENELLGKISNLTGKTLMTINTKDIDVSSLSAGIYVLDIVSDNKRYVSKIVKE